MSNKGQLQENNERLLDIAEKLLKLTSGGAEPVEWEKGVNINDLGTGYFYLDAKLEDGDWEVMGLPEKYGAGWQGVYLVIKGNAGYGYEAYMRDFYDDTLWYTFLEGWSDTYWNQIITDEQMDSVLEQLTPEGIGAAPASHTHVIGEVGITYGPTDLEAGTSALESGKIYLVYE